MTIATTPDELGPGTKLDRYEIVRAVAQGGMGEVWLGRLAGKHGFEKPVAIKTILPRFAADKRFHDMFLDEARITSKLVHANVAQILDLGDHEGTIYIVFEWVEGSSLESVCRSATQQRRPLPLGLLLRIVADAAAGLHAAHELADDAGERLQVVHRDVTPENILVSEAGVAKIIDFGVAKARDRVAGQTRSGLVKGTPQYMAPEQASGTEVDRRADVWSLGAVLFRALSGGPPFAARDDLASFVMGKEPLAKLPESVPADVRATVDRAMQRFPADRFATADEMRRALEASIRAHGAEASAAEIAALVKSLAPQKPRRTASSELATAPDASAVPGAGNASPYSVTELAAAATEPAAPAVPLPRTDPRTEPRTDPRAATTAPRAASAPRAGDARPEKTSRALQVGIFVAVFVTVVALAVALFLPGAAAP